MITNLSFARRLPRRKYLYFASCLVVVLSLATCFVEQKIAVSYGAANHTDKGIVAILVNNEGGVLGVDPGQGGAPEVCCVLIPRKWSPDLTVNIKWQEDSEYLRDKNGEVVVNDGKPVLVPAPWKERTVKVHEYDSAKGMGNVYIHFFPNDEVRVTVSVIAAFHSSYPYYPFHSTAPND